MRPTPNDEETEMNTNKSIAALALTAALFLGAGGVGQARAQVVRGGLPGGPSTFVGPGGPVALTPGYGYGYGYGLNAVATAPAPPFTYSASYVPPYSYYAAIQAGIPARIYTGAGPSDFPYYGRPYGLPNDTWSWSYMSSGGYRNALARYYYPPLGF
jgi:hypothetical protein